MKYHPLKTTIALLCMASTLMLSGCNEEEEEKKAPLRYVKSMAIMGGSGTYEQSFSGRLHASSEVSFSFKVSGTIDSLPVNVGDRVSKGDVLAKLDASDYELEVEKAQASLAKSNATSRNAKANYERVKRLYAAGNTSRNDLDSARADADTSAASAQADRKALEIAKKDLSYTALKAEADCAIASVDPDVGENVNSGDQIIFATCGDDLEVKLNIPESVISYITKGMSVDVSFSAIEGTQFKGKVSEVGVSSVGNSTTFPVDVLVTDSDQSALKAGLSADVTFTIDASKKGRSLAIIVPPFAVGSDENGRFVYVIEPKEDTIATVRRTAVGTGDAMQSGVEITRGLNPGMRIVVAGVTGLRDGMEVKVSNE